MNHFPDEPEYFMFQDSLEIVEKGWESAYRTLGQDTRLVSMCGIKIKDDPCPGCGMKEFSSICDKEWPMESYLTVCNSFYIPYSAKNKLKSCGISNVVANNKNDTYATERVIGALAYCSCGISDVSEILGNWVWDGLKYLPGTGFTKYIYKHIKYRQ